MWDPAKAWPWAIAGVLALTVAANLALLAAANAPGAAVPEPDYYARALHWDVTQAERARSAALGWHATAEFRGGELRVHVADAAGAAVTAAKVRVTGVHNLLPDAPQDWPLPEVADGRYAANVRPPHGGRWELRLVAERGGDRYVVVLHADAARGGPR